MSKHTPGPWVAKDSAGAGLGIWADLRPALGEKYSKDFPIYGNSALHAPQIQIAYEAWVQFPNGKWNEMQKANSYLIAAAPELLESLTNLLAMCERQTDFNDDGDGGMLARCAAAISKATGEQP